MKRKLACVLILSLLLAALAGCSGSKDSLLTGKWTTVVDLAPVYEKLLAETDQTIAAHVRMEKFPVALTLEFLEDGSYRVTTDQTQVEAGTNAMLASISTGLENYLEQETGMDIDDLLAVSGTTMDELMAQYFDPDLASTIAASLESRGTWELDDRSLTMTDDDGTVYFSGKCDLEEDSLELTSGEAPELVAQLMPLTLDRD